VSFTPLCEGISRAAIIQSADVDHYLVAIALSNLAYVYLNKKDYARAELFFRDVVRRITETLGAHNVNTGIARIELGAIPSISQNPTSATTRQRERSNSSPK
jgi:tetratricopeptide repeat protein